MKTYVATVCLTKSYTDKMCNQVLLQKEFPDEKAAHVWLNKALKRYNYVKGIKDLCYVSWFSLDDWNGCLDVVCHHAIHTRHQAFV